MSESQTQSYKPASAGARRVSPVLVWTLVLLVAAGAFVVAFYWAGGVTGVSAMLGFGSQQPAATPKSVSAAAKPSSVPTLPLEAQALMYTEQLQSQPEIAQLGDGRIVSMSLGTPVVTGDAAIIPVTVVLKTGHRAKGTLTLKRYDGTWYFTGIRAIGDSESTPAMPTSFDAGVVKVVTEQQAQPPTQDLIKGGLLGGGYTEVTVDEIVNGSGTKTLNVSMSGGSEAPESGRLVLIEKTDGADTYWFVARFEKQ